MEKIKVKDAAAMLGVTEQFIRIGLQRGQLPIGAAVKFKSRWAYHISPAKLREYIGEVNK